MLSLSMWDVVVTLVIMVLSKEAGGLFVSFYRFVF